MSDAANESVRTSKGSRMFGKYLAGCFSGCAISFIMLLVLPVSLCYMLCTSVTKEIGSLAKFSNGLDADVKVRTPVSYSWRWGDGGKDDPKIARLYLNGEIREEEEREFLLLSLVRKNFEHPLISKIRAVTENPSFDGIWLEVNSPGGSVALSDEIYHMLCRFRESSKGRFVFVYFKAQACSGGYYIAAAGDKIMAGPTAWTGSIGVVVPGYNASGLAEKIGVKSLNVVSSENKALLDPFQPVNTNHLAIVQRAVDQTYDNFLSIVSERRKIPKTLLRPVADGRIITAKDALEYNLIDAVGYEEDAMAEVLKLAKIRKPGAGGMRVYSVETGDGPLGLPFSFELGKETSSSFFGKVLRSRLGEDSALPAFRR